MKNEQYENFERTARALMKVPHSEIKAKLDAEKEAKKASKKQRVTRRREV